MDKIIIFAATIYSIWNVVEFDATTITTFDT